MTMAQQSAPNCCLRHDPATGASLLGVSVLTPSPNPQPLPELLPLKKGQQLHEHMANMGGTRVIPLKDYKEAGKGLMERNMPDVLHNRQTEVVFLPEANMPRMPRVVDLEKYETKKGGLDEKELAFLGMKRGSKNINNALGDIVERYLAEELKDFFAKTGNTNVVDIQGDNFRVPGKSKGAIEEHDFIIIEMAYKLIICIECKVTLTGSTGHSAVEQTKKLQKLLEEYFAGAGAEPCLCGALPSNQQPLHHCQRRP